MGESGCSTGLRRTALAINPPGFHHTWKPKFNMVAPRICSYLARIPVLALILILIAGTSFGAQRSRKHRRHASSRSRTKAIKKSKVRQTRTRVRPAKYTVPSRIPAPVIRGGPWTEPTYADSTVGDNVDGEDLDV